jgi:diguanylate cyclase (GGDEF)-like protein/putative nucleotidyltransferase with HDIG domain
MFWTGFMITSTCFVIVAYYHFIRAYNAKPAGIGVIVGYAIVLMVLTLSLAGFLVKDAYFGGGLLNYDIFPWDLIITAALAPFLVMAIILLYRRYKVSIDPVDRNRTTYLIAGWGILVLMGYIIPFAPLLKTVPVAYLGNLANAAIISYTILNFNLVNLRTILRKLLTYVIVIALLFGLTAAIVFAYPNFIEPLPVFVIVILLSLIYTFVIISASPLIQLITKGVEYLFFRGTYDYRRELLNFNRKMSHIITLDELAKEILPTITKAVNIPGASLILQDSRTGNFETQYKYPEDSESVEGVLKDISFDADSPVITWMEKKGMALNLAQMDKIPDFKEISQSEKIKITDSDICMLFPFKSRDKLIGMLALGNKPNQMIMSHEDIELISNITTQAGVIIENAQLYTHARMRANTDELTGLYNHRHFHECLDQEITRASRLGGTFSLIMMDVDLFKSYNDIYGHLAGDMVLRKVGEYIDISIREIDMAFRYGGEEFAVLLPGAHIDDAYKVAERIRKTIESKTSSKAMPITISVGVANWPNDGVIKEEIIGRADEALYRAKQMGRNRTCMSSNIQKHEGALTTADIGSNPKALSIIYALAATVDAKDNYTYGHSRKVSEYAIAIAKALELPEGKVNNIRSAGLLHDIGKIGIPEQILNKEGPLDEDEKELIKKHPEAGVEILRYVVELVGCIPAILHHHERYDGAGYPAGLSGGKIPIEARVLAVADAYDAMVSPRSYRRQLSEQEALDELKKYAGTQFDPDIVEVFSSIIQNDNADIADYNIEHTTGHRKND